jgi:hypothetical protein
VNATAIINDLDVVMVVRGEEREMQAGNKLKDEDAYLKKQKIKQMLIVKEGKKENLS